MWTYLKTHLFYTTLTSLSQHFSIPSYFNLLLSGKIYFPPFSRSVFFLSMCLLRLIFYSRLFTLTLNFFGCLSFWWSRNWGIFCPLLYVCVCMREKHFRCKFAVLISGDSVYVFWCPNNLMLSGVGLRARVLACWHLIVTPCRHGDYNKTLAKCIKAGIVTVLLANTRTHTQPHHEMCVTHYISTHHTHTYTHTYTVQMSPF